MAQPRDVAVPALPAGTRLLHVGPHKTGTTALQGSLWTAREALLAQGVRHAGTTRNPSNAVRAVTGQPSPFSDTEPPPIRHWHALVREVRAAREPRVVVSSEFFAWAEPEVVRRIATDLDAERLHVVVTLRPLARIIPSMWQQNIQAGQVYPFDDWLRGVLAAPPKTPNASFWMLHRHDELIARWATVLGTERVTALVVDERDHAFLPRTFEALLGVQAGTLGVVEDYANRSLTVPEVEAVRAFNLAFREAGLPRAVHAGVVRFGAAQEMKRRVPPADEPRVALPPWAAPRVAELAAEVVAGIGASGVRVIGELSTLVPAAGSDRPGGPRPGAEPAGVPPAVAASLAMGILAASGAAGRADGGIRGRLRREPPEVVRLSTRQLLGYGALRLARPAVRALSRLRAAVRRS